MPPQGMFKHLHKLKNKTNHNHNDATYTFQMRCLLFYRRNGKLLP
jgi:hypothetical protein